MGAIAVVADGQAVANSDAPSKMIFYTTADGGDALTTALTLDKSQNATFAGTVTSPTFLGDLNGTINTATTGTTQTAGNNSTLIATTAYADAAAAAVPIGNYLPLSAGSSYPLTGALHTNGTIFMSAGNPGIIMQETDVTDKNWDIQVNGGNLKFYEVNDARSVFSEKVTFEAGGNARDRDWETWV